MKTFAIAISILLFLIGCSSDQADPHDVEKIIKNRLENNEVEINLIKDELKAHQIDTRQKNINLITKIEQLHKDIIKLNHVIDINNSKNALALTNAFIEKKIKSVYAFNTIPLQLDYRLPKSILKLQVALLETSVLIDSKDKYDFGELVRFDKLQVFVIPDKAFINGGEVVSGKVIYGAVVDINVSKKIIKKILVNGHPAIADTTGWNFSFIPSAKGKGISNYDLTARVVIGDTTLSSKSTIYIQH
jgi:hypothetical protein